MDASDGDGDGDNVSRLTKNFNDPAGDWRPDLSPDGTKIAFISDRSGSFGPGDGPFEQEIYWDVAYLDGMIMATTRPDSPPIPLKKNSLTRPQMATRLPSLGRKRVRTATSASML